MKYNEYNIFFNEIIRHRVLMNMTINMNYFIQGEGIGAFPYPMMSQTLLK